jgi:hypothetical protein
LTWRWCLPQNEHVRVVVVVVSFLALAARLLNRIGCPSC